MTERVVLAGLVLASMLAADTSDTVRHVVVGSDDTVVLNATPFQYSSVVMDVDEKALTSFCGDPNYLEVEIIEGAERYVLIKPKVVGRTTNVHVVTDHGHDYVIKVYSVAAKSQNPPPDAKLFIEPADPSSLKKPPSAVPASQYARVEADLKAATDQIASLQKQKEADAKDKEQALQKQADSLAVGIPHSLHFDYTFTADKAPFNIHGIWNDGKFTYIKADPEETASLYELKDGKLNLVEMEYFQGSYTVRKVMDGGVLQVGKKKTEFFRKPGR